jgi:hypothetical protein
MGDTMSDNQVNENQNIYQIKMHRWRMAFFGLVILLAGIIIGGAASLLVVWRVPIGPMPGPERVADRMIQGLLQELRLSPQQRQQIEPIIRRHMERIDQIRKEARPQIEGHLRQMNEEIMPILDDQQRMMWIQMQQRLPMEQPSPGQMRPMLGPERTAERMIQGLQELHLSPQQRQQIEPIIHRYMERLGEMRRNGRPLNEDGLRLMNEEIAPILDDQQKAAWMQMQQRLQMESLPDQMRSKPRPDMPFEQQPQPPPLPPRPENSPSPPMPQEPP